MKLLFYVSNYPHYITSLKIVEWFKNNNYKINVEFLVLDNYSRASLSEKIAELGYIVHSIPRKSKSNISILNSAYEYEKNFLSVNNYYNRILKISKFDLAIIFPYERGLWEVLFIKNCKKNEVKTLLLQEGLVITEDNKEANLYDKPKEYFLLNQPSAIKNKKSKIFNTNIYKKLYSKILESINDKDIKILLRSIYYNYYSMKFPIVRPFGLNGADYIGTFSNYYSQKLNERGLDTSQTHAVGLARFDAINDFINNKNGFVNWPKFPQNKVIKILIPQFWGFQLGREELVYLYIEQIKMISNELQNRNIIITFRLRPEEVFSDYIKLFSNYSNIHIEQASKVSAYESIFKNDIIISGGSTMILEALALKRYCIIFSPIKDDVYSYYKSGCCLMSWNSNSLIKSINEICENKEKQKILVKNANKFIIDRAMIDGMASERTCKLIEFIVNN